MFVSPFSIAITSLGEEKANLSAFRTFVRFAFVWFFLFPLPLGVWEGLRFVIVALPRFFPYFFFYGRLHDFASSYNVTASRLMYVLPQPSRLTRTRTVLFPHFLARLNNVLEELLYYPRRRRWRWRPQMLKFALKFLRPHYFLPI